MRTSTLPITILSVLALMAGCSSESESSPGAVGADGGVGPDVDAASSAPTSGLGFTPTNLGSVDLSAPLADTNLGSVDLRAPLADIVLEDCGEQIRAGETARLACIEPNDPAKLYRFTTVTQPDGTKVKVFVVNSLRVPSGVTSEIVVGDDPVAIIALDKIEIEGAISVSSIATAGGFKVPSAPQNGNGPGGGKGATTGAGDGGGAYCGAGGRGAGAGGGAGGTPYGNPEISPLLGGSSGANLFAGNGGGALQLVARNLVRISTGGSINMGGRGSDTGGAGSGGAILIEAAEVVVAGKLAANGGGGGAGTGPNDGQDGQLASEPTPEGTGDASGGGGGKGGAGTAIDGQPGVVNTTFANGDFAGNGGGGAGRIRINTRSGSASITGLVSPALTTVCATQGLLR